MDSLKTNGKYSPVKLIIAITGLITVLSGAALSWFKTIVGEPEAEEAKARIDITWKKSMAELTELKRQYARLHTRVLYFQGREEGLTAGALQAKLDQVQAKYDALLVKTSKPTRRTGTPNPVVEVLRGELVEVRKLRKKLERERKGVKAVKSAKPQVEQKPAAPPWGK
jgi:hypothetical protein